MFVKGLRIKVEGLKFKDCQSGTGTSLRSLTLVRKASIIYNVVPVPEY